MSTSTHNGVVNFHSYIDSGVDLRTGTFSTNILLATLIEPDFDVRLTYSPLNQKDFGFGHGWRIPVTIYNTKSHLLSLADGRLYDVETKGAELKLKDSTGEVKLEKITSPDRLKVTYRDTGIVEWLEKKSHWYACIARTTPIGDALYFVWKVVEDSKNPKIHLTEAFKSSTAFNSVDDDGIEKTVLLSITMDALKPKIEIWPKTEEARTFSLSLDENYLKSMDNESFEPALNWKFKYDGSVSPSILSTVVSPSGKCESADYSNDEPLYPGAPPRVKVYWSDSVTVYDYRIQPIKNKSTEKFEAGNLVVFTRKLPGSPRISGEMFSFEKSPDSVSISRGTLDWVCQLEHTLSVYDKSKFMLIYSVELLCSPEDLCKVFKRIQCELSGDIQKLISHERSVFRQRKMLTDGGLADEPYLNPQRETSAHYSLDHPKLPIQEDTRYYNITNFNGDPEDVTDLAKSTIYVKHYSWDAYGRLLKKTNENGSTAEYTYVDSEGVNELISHEVLTPYVNESTHQSTLYAYEKLEGRAYALNSIPKQSCHILSGLCRKMLTHSVSGDYQVYKSEAVKTDGFDRGRLKQQTTFRIPKASVKKDGKIDDIIHGHKPDQTTVYSYELKDQTLKITATTTGSDGCSTTYERTTSALSGVILSEKDIDGNISAYTWDSLSRLNRTVNNSGTPYETEEKFTHEIIEDEEDVKALSVKIPTTDLVDYHSYILHSDTANRVVLAVHDHGAREVASFLYCEAGPKNNPPAKWIRTQTKLYDNSGRVVSHTKHTETTAITSHVVYDLPNCYWSYTERAASKFDITHVLLDEANKSRIITYIDSDNLTEFPAQEDSPTDPISPILGEIDHSEGDLKSYLVPRFQFKPKKNVCWSRVEYLDTNGNVTETRIYTMDADEKIASSSEEAKTSVLQPTLHSSRRYSYNWHNANTSFTDERGNITSLQYDDLNRLTAITRPDASTISYAYAAGTEKPLATEVSITSGGKKTIIGTQLFDSLERLKESVSGGRKHTYEYQGATQSPQKITSPDGTALTYEVIAELGGVVKSIKATGLTHTFDYFPGSGLLKKYSDQSGYSSTLAYDKQCNIIKEDIVSGSGNASRTLTQSFSSTGQRQDFTDATNDKQSFAFDNDHISVSEDASTKVQYEYGAFGRVHKQTITDKKNKKSLIVKYSYDILGNETSRTIEIPDQSEALVIKQVHQKNGQLESRQIMQGKKTLRDERFTYTSVDLLETYTCTGNDLPLDGYNKPISKLTFKYDALGNITQCVTDFGKESDTASFLYENDKDPCQLSKVTHSHKDYPTSIVLAYDANGRMTKNERGQTLAYDALNRLSSLKDGKDTYLYHYDPKGKLTSRTKLSVRSEWLYQPGGRYPLLSNKIEGDVITRITRIGEQVAATVAQSGKSSTPDSVQLIATDALNSPVIALDNGTRTDLLKYSPSGHPASPRTPGYFAELYDDVSGVYHLGERQYSPCLFRFTTPDSWSPFGLAGLNAYAYLDPVNCPDPEGHLSDKGIFAILMGVAFIVLGIVTLGSSIAAFAAVGLTLAVGLAIAGALATVAAGALGVASGALSDSDPELSRKLEWASFGVGIVGAGFTLGAGFAAGAARTSIGALRAGAPRLGRMARYAVTDAVSGGVQMQPLAAGTAPALARPITRSGVTLAQEFVGHSRYAFSSSSSVTSGIQSAASGMFFEAFARIAAQPAARMLGVTMGMMALLGLGIGAKQHAEMQASS